MSSAREKTMHTPPPYEQKSPNIRIWLILAAIGMLITGATLFALTSLDITSRLFPPQITHQYNDRYASDGKHVYFHDNGYQKTEGADHASFRPIAPDEHFQGYHSRIAGRDKQAVFVGSRKISTLNPDTTRLLKAGYLTDGTRLYYEDQPIPEGDPESFTSLIGFYAKDARHLYYKGKPLPGADMATLTWLMEKPQQKPAATLQHLPPRLQQLFYNGTTSNRKNPHYMKDARQVYYHDLVVKGADPESFHPVDVAGDQWGMHYAKDRHQYYFKGRPFPGTIANTGEKIDPAQLKLLQADRNFGWMELFWLEKKVYVFNTNTHTLEHFFTRDSSAPFTMITRGVYKDDRQVWFSASQDHYASAFRGRGKRLVGKYSIFQPLAGVTPENFTKTTTLEKVPAKQRGEIFEANGIHYFHPRHRDQGAALYLLHTPETAIGKNSLKNIEREDKYVHYLALQPAWQRHGYLFIIGILIAIAVSVRFLKKTKA